MADAVLLRKAAMKVVTFALIVGIGHWMLWPDVPVEEWFQDNSGWKMKFAFIGWVALSVGMAYDTLVELAKGIMANPDPRRR